MLHECITNREEKAIDRKLSPCESINDSSYRAKHVMRNAQILRQQNV